MKNGSATLVATIAMVCLIVGGVSGAVVSDVMIEGPNEIDIPEGTLIVLENGDPYYYFENGPVITNRVFEIPIDNRENFVVVWPENYVPSSDNFVIVFRGWQDNYVIVPSDNTFNVYPIPKVSIAIWFPEDVEWKVVEKSENYPGWFEIEGRPEYISVEWPEEYYEYDIRLRYDLCLENWLVFSLRPSG